MNVVTPPLEIIFPVTLEGATVRLEPIRHAHAAMFWDVAKNALDSIFQWFPYRVTSREDFHLLVGKALAEQERGDSVAFAMLSAALGEWLAVPAS